MSLDARRRRRRRRRAGDDGADDRRERRSRRCDATRLGASRRARKVTRGRQKARVHVDDRPSRATRVDAADRPNDGATRVARRVRPPSDRSTAFVAARSARA